MILGFDIGGTKSAVILAEVKGETIDFLGRYEMKTERHWRSVLDELSMKAKEMISSKGLANEPLQIGVSCGGPLDAERGQILSPPNLPGWDEVPVVKYLEEQFKAKARLQNDADACALAEWKYGAGRGTQHMVFLKFGTGLGAGLILNGKLYRGADNMAGEAGHIRLTEDGPMGYGKRGSFEGYCSGGGIAQLAKKKAEEERKSGRTVSYLKDELENITAKDVALAAENGHEDAKEIFRISGRYFGRGLAIIVDLLNPEMIVAGSIYKRSGHLMKEEMMKELEKEAIIYSRKNLKILPSSLGEAIGDYGAVAAALGE